MKKGDIVSVVAMSGEYIGELVDNKDGIELANPKMIVQAPDGGMGFAKRCSNGVINPKTMFINNYVFVCETNEQVAEAYRTALSGIEYQKRKRL